jgi:dCTP deaminase
VGVYSNSEIKAAIKSGQLIFHPYVEEHIAGSSIDVTLGEWYYKTERNNLGGVYNPFDPKAVENYFDGPYRAENHSDWCESHGRKLFTGIPEDQPIIALEPGERILANTHEFVGIKGDATSTMQARSTWGRNGVAVCLDAGWGDPGYINRWTMEIYNMNQRDIVILPVGERIAQLVFYKTGPVEGEYHKLSGKYQGSEAGDLETLIANWKPEQMLPRAYKDDRRKPLDIKT